MFPVFTSFKISIITSLDSNSQVVRLIFEETVLLNQVVSVNIPGS